jgi:hypothetical protein
MAVCERRLYSHFVKDLTDVGFDVSQLPSNMDVAQMHMKMRAGGHKVRPIDQLFNQARDDYLAWRGLPPKGAPARPNPPAPPAPPAPRPRNGTPRVEVNVDRSARRAQIPTQPPHAASPHRVPMVEEPARTNVESRTAAAQRMIEQRRRGRGAAF